MTTPNYPAFDAQGNLYVTNSGLMVWQRRLHLLCRGGRDDCGNRYREQPVSQWLRRQSRRPVPLCGNVAQSSSDHTLSDREWTQGRAHRDGCRTASCRTGRPGLLHRRQLSDLLLPARHDFCVFCRAAI